MHPMMRVINVPWDGIRRAGVIAAKAPGGKRRLPWANAARIAANWPSEYSCGRPRVHAKHGFATTGPLGRSQNVSHHFTCDFSNVSPAVGRELGEKRVFRLS